MIPPSVSLRALNLDHARMARLDSAIRRAAAKGSKHSIVMLDDLAIAVDVREGSAVSADQGEGGWEGVFTNIDSVVIA